MTLWDWSTASDRTSNGREGNVAARAAKLCITADNIALCLCYHASANPRQHLLMYLGLPCNFLVNNSKKARIQNQCIRLGVACRVHIIHLALYNLTVAEGGRKGFFRWNDDICGFIQQNWSRLMPQRKKTQSWHSTVAGILSVNCPTVFQSGEFPLPNFVSL